MSIDQTLEDRGKQYGGSYAEQAEIVQALKKIAHNAPQWDGMSADKKESIDLIFTKLSRILYGNPDHHDSWHDIIGYARLIEKELDGV